MTVERAGAARAIRYRLPAGDRFTIDASMHERVLMDDEVVLDLDIATALDCEVVEADTTSVWIVGRVVSPTVGGSVSGAEVPVLASDASVRVRKGLDGTIHDVEGAEDLEGLLGGLTVANGLRFLAACFPSAPVAPGDRWTATDVWNLRADRSPLGGDLPLSSRVDVRYDYTLRAVGEGPDAIAAIAVDMAFSGRSRSEELGVDLECSGEGHGNVEVDLDIGKLTSSRREATVRFEPKAFRSGATALPTLTLHRRSLAGVRISSRDGA